MLDLAFHLCVGGRINVSLKKYVAKAAIIEASVLSDIKKYFTSTQ
jgi:hypothetical protein